MDDRILPGDQLPAFSSKSGCERLSKGVKNDAGDVGPHHGVPTMSRAYSEGVSVVHRVSFFPHPHPPSGRHLCLMHVPRAVNANFMERLGFVIDKKGSVGNDDRPGGRSRVHFESESQVANQSTTRQGDLKLFADDGGEAQLHASSDETRDPDEAAPYSSHHTDNIVDKFLRRISREMKGRREEGGEVEVKVTHPDHGASAKYHERRKSDHLRHGDPGERTSVGIIGDRVQGGDRDDHIRQVKLDAQGRASGTSNRSPGRCARDEPIDSTERKRPRRRRFDSIDIAPTGRYADSRSVQVDDGQDADQSKDDGSTGRAAEKESFTGNMWESTWCRQVLDAMFFGPGSLIPAGSGEEYKELEEFVPKYLARRAAAKVLPSRDKSVRLGKGGKDHSLAPAATGVTALSAPGALPPALATLPKAFHKRYLMNFAVLTPDQQRAAEETAWRKHPAVDYKTGAASWDKREMANAPSFRYALDQSKAAMKELARQGVLEREEVGEMLRSGAMQDFGGSILQAFYDFRMRRSLARVHKIRQDRATLPIAKYRDAILAAVASNRCVLIAGDTGCGKSTQVPQFLLQAGYRRVACTQPRRISAVGLCRRVSYETLNEHGAEVAYQVRFDSSRQRSSRILFLTEGLLLRQIASDPDLSAYSIVIVDEVHERHAGCDFLLGLLREIVKRREDLKVVLMSATINPELFSRYFDGAPLIKVPGRVFPVELRYVPTSADTDVQEVLSRHDGEGQRKLRSRGGTDGKRQLFDTRPYVKLLQTIDATTPRDERGDMLVFLSGMGDMLAVSEGVREYVEAKNPREWVVLMLHSSLSIDEQDKVFDAAPLGTRKMILATNIAETSVTIDGVRFVADSGKAKEMSWDPRSGVRSLQEFWVSRASAEQRKGRAGRTGPGICFRFYSRHTFERLAPFAEPEIRRCPLEGLVLQMKSLGLQDPRLFPYLSPPSPENLNAALQSLALLGATDAARSGSVAPAAVVHPVAPEASRTGKGRVATPRVASDEHTNASSMEGEKQTDVVKGSVRSVAPGVAGIASKTQPKSSSLLGFAPASTAASVFEDATARAPLTPLGRVLWALPVDPSVGKMLALGALFGESEHVLTLAAAMTAQTPFEARLAGSAAGTNPVAEFASPDGDPFTVMNAYDEWIRIKASRQESSRRWCKRHGLQEQRLYEITKLRRQFEELLASSGLLWLGAAAERARRGRLGRRGPLSGYGGAGTNGGAISREKLRALRMKREGRKRKVLEVYHADAKDDGEKSGARESGGGDEDEGDADAEEAQRELMEEIGDAGAEAMGLDLSSLEFYMAQDVDQLAESSGRRLTRRDVAILKAILCQGLYPQFAVADARNASRPSTEQQYVTRPSGGIFMNPSSVLASYEFGAGMGSRGSADARVERRGRKGKLESGSTSAAEGGRRDGLLCYGQLMETQRPFLSSVTPLPALQSLLLFSSKIDTSEDASLMLFDHWLLVEMRGAESALTGQKLLVLACGLRARLHSLLTGALQDAERRRGRGIGSLDRRQHRLWDRPDTNTGVDGIYAKGGQGQDLDADPEQQLEDLPPLLRMARRAWQEVRNGTTPRGAELQPAMDWAQEAEDLSVELADFMLQSIGYDIKSITPGQVETLLVDPSRLNDPAEVRRVLETCSGPLKTSGEMSEGHAGSGNTGIGGAATVSGGDKGMPELLAALSRAVEEEIRGSKGLFGLETGVLEQLKRGPRVTPFLRHGSVRRRTSDGPLPHGLAAGGLKKWWRCPRCHVSQVVNLEAIHEHFKVCPDPNAPAEKEAGADPSSHEAPKRIRFVGTSVKGSRIRK